MPSITQNKYVFAAIFIFAGVGPITLSMIVGQRGDNIPQQASAAETTTAVAQR